MTQCKAPSPLKLTAGINEFEEWTQWKKKFVFHLKGTESFNKNGVIKGNILLANIGDAAIKI